MTLSQEFFMDVLNIMNKKNLYCIFQTDFDALKNSIKQISSIIVEDDYFFSFPLNKTNKKILIDNVIQYNSEQYIYHFEIQGDNIPLVLAHDGFEIVEIASTIQLSDNFINKYVRTGQCIVWEKIIYPRDQIQYNIHPTRVII